MVQVKQGQQALKIERGVKRSQKQFAIETSSVAETEYAAMVEQSALKHGIEQWMSKTRLIIEEDLQSRPDTLHESNDSEIEDMSLVNHMHCRIIYNTSKLSRHNRETRALDFLPL